MNKKIKEATSQEIVGALKDDNFSNALELIKHSYKSVYECCNGEFIYKAPELKDFCNVGLGLEYRLYRSNKARKKRMNGKVKKITKTEKAIFLTMTFNDTCLSKTSEKYRKRKIKEFLRSQCIKYIANIDYGSKNDREHYHAIVEPYKEQIDTKLYNSMFYGSNINCKRFKISKSNSSERVATYINKMTNHTLKENGHAPRLIYSRVRFGATTDKGAPAV